MGKAETSDNQTPLSHPPPRVFPAPAEDPEALSGESDVLSRVFLQGSLAGCCIDESGKVSAPNTAMLVLFGYGRPQLITFSVLDLLVGLRPKDWSAKWRAASEKGVHKLQCEARQSTGRHFPAEVILSFSAAAGKAICGAFFRDISSEKNAELEYGRLLCLTELNPNPIVEADFSGRVFYLNTAAHSLFTDIEGRRFEHPFLRGLDELCQAAESRRAGSLRREVQVGNAYYEQVIHYAGEIRRLRIFAVDITRQKSSQKRLEEQGAFFRKVIDTAPYFIFAKDREGRFTLVNKSVADAYGTTVEELTGKTDADYNSNPEEVKHFRKDDMEVMTSLQPMFIPEEVITDASGKQRWLQTVKLPLVDEQGRVTHILGASTEITERKQAEQERRELEARIQHSQKLESLGVLAGGIAHDFNNLLMGILGNASLALMSLPPDAPEYSFIAKLKTAAERAAELTNQLLAFSGRGKFVVARMDLSSTIREMSELLRTAISKKADMEYHFRSQLPLIEADPSQLRQIIMNLIMNASEALGDRPGKIAIRTGLTDAGEPWGGRVYLEDNLQEKSYVYVEVTDTGVGIDNEILDRIFDPFFTTKFTGRGLGLAD